MVDVALAAGPLAGAAAAPGPEVFYLTQRLQRLTAQNMELKDANLRLAEELGLRKAEVADLRQREDAALAKIRQLHLEMNDELYHATLALEEHRTESRALLEEERRRAAELREELQQRGGLVADLRRAAEWTAAELQQREAQHQRLVQALESKAEAAHQELERRARASSARAVSRGTMTHPAEVGEAGRGGPLPRHGAPGPPSPAGSVEGGSPAGPAPRPRRPSSADAQRDMLREMAAQVAFWKTAAEHANARAQQVQAEAEEQMQGCLRRQQGCREELRSLADRTQAEVTRLQEALAREQRQALRQRLVHDAAAAKAATEASAQWAADQRRLLAEQREQRRLHHEEVRRLRAALREERERADRLEAQQQAVEDQPERCAPLGGPPPQPYTAERRTPRRPLQAPASPAARCGSPKKSLPESKEEFPPPSPSETARRSVIFSPNASNSFKEELSIGEGRIPSGPLGWHGFVFYQLQEALDTLEGRHSRAVLAESDWPALVENVPGHLVGGGAPPKGRPAVLELVRRLKADAARTQQRLEDLLLAMEGMRAHQAARRGAAAVLIQRVFRGHRCRVRHSTALQKKRDQWQEVQVVERLEHVERQGLCRAWLAGLYDLEAERDASAAVVHSGAAVREAWAALTLQRVVRGWRVRCWLRRQWPALLGRREARERRRVAALEAEATETLHAWVADGGRLLARHRAAITIQRRVRGHLAHRRAAWQRAVREQCATLEMAERQQRRAVGKAEAAEREKWSLRLGPRRPRALP